MILGNPYQFGLLQEIRRLTDLSGKVRVCIIKLIARKRSIGFNKDNFGRILLTSFYKTNMTILKNM